MAEDGDQDDDADVENGAGQVHEGGDYGEEGEDQVDEAGDDGQEQLNLEPEDDGVDEEGDPEPEVDGQGAVEAASGSSTSGVHR